MAANYALFQAVIGGHKSSRIRQRKDGKNHFLVTIEGSLFLILRLRRLFLFYLWFTILKYSAVITSYYASRDRTILLQRCLTVTFPSA